MCITTKILKMALICHLHIFKKNHGAPPILLNLLGATSVKVPYKDT
jgi:hypothetical protein